MKRLQLSVFVAVLVAAIGASAQTGVSDDRVSLPEGPGSLEGVGENVSVDGNMGLVSHSVAINLPAGFAGMTPDVSLSYSSGNGNGVVGMGWGMTFPAIERLTLRGLPEYDTDDEFAVNGSEQLVRIPGTDPPMYRSRFERSFVRYSWLDAADGSGGYWRAEYPDGRIGYFGAKADGTAVETSRVTGPQGVFRYHLTEMVDRWGHRMVYSYNLYGNVTLPVHIGYVFEDGAPRYEVTFEYEDRTDKQSDCRPGFEELLEKRLHQINIRAANERIRRYLLVYEAMADSGGMSRIARVETLGQEDSLYPIVHSFGYTQALGAECTDQLVGCDKPYVVTMPTALGVNLTAGNTTLIDINGDGLSDILDTSQEGAHRFFINTLIDGQPHDFSAALESAVGTQNTHDLSSKAVQVLDVNGDGFTDILNAQQGSALMNLGGGDWEPTPLQLWEGDGAGGLPGDFVPEDGELNTVRFLDFDNDKRIDVIKSTGSDVANATLIYRNTGDGAFQLVEGVQPIGAAFDTETIELNDMNGDGLLDPVQVQATLVRYRLNLGRGVWDEWREISGFSFTDQEQVDAELEDLNGDALADIVLVSGNEVRYWLNRNGDTFEGPVVLSSDDVEGGLPTKEDKVVLFADINGNGSSDVVWIDDNGLVTYLELFPVRPNLLTHIENGIGRVTSITYASSVEEQARSGGPGSWKYDLPSPMTLVKEVNETDTLTGVELVTRYTYENGYYDGEEKDFRGYEDVVTDILGDDRQEAGQRVERYDVGADDDYEQGLLRWREAYSAGALISRVELEYDECPVAGVPDEGLLFDVRYVCQTLERTLNHDGLPASEAAITEVASTYDGYGQVVLKEERGVVSIGGSACDVCAEEAYTGTPCGPQCLGDERYTATEYVTPDDNADNWILGLTKRERSYGEADEHGAPATEHYAETTSYYDGPAFEGMAFGKATHGFLTREVERVDASGTTIDTLRARHDVHGNMVEKIFPNGSLEETDNFRVVYGYDGAGLRRIRTDLLLRDDQGAYVLREDRVWDERWGTIAAGSDRYIPDSGTEPAWTHFDYDEFGRMVARTEPGGDPSSPSAVYTYDIGTSVTRIVTERRSTVDGPLDLIGVQCMDGHGRTYQRRTRIREGEWMVSGFQIFGAHGKTREEYVPYHGTTGACDAAPPAETPSDTIRLDAVGRVLRIEAPTGAGDPAPAVESWEYAPLSKRTYDPEDNRVGGPHENTPDITHYNGLGQTVATERQLADGTVLRHEIRYDPLGNIRSVTDAAGLTKTMTYDYLGRLVATDDPDRGTQTYEYDANGNVIRTVDAVGHVTRSTFDAGDRAVRSWAEGNEANTLVEYYFDRPEACAECLYTAGRLAEVRFALGDGTTAVDQVSYDIRGEQVWFARTLWDRTLAISREVDHQGRVHKVTYPGGRELTYTLDGLDRIEAIDGVVSGIQYAPTGLLTSAELANGTSLVKTWDDRARLVDLMAVGEDAIPILAYEYRWDRAANLVSVTDERVDDDNPMGGAEYEYDALYRITKATLDPSRPQFTEVVTYGWDSADRLVSKLSSLGSASAAHVGALTYGTGQTLPRAVTSAGGLAYSYDAAGRMTGRGDVSIERDEYGAVSRVTRGGDTIGVMAYDPNGDRVVHRSPGHLSLELTEDFEVRDFSAVVSVEIAGERIARLEQPAFAAMILSDVAPAEGADEALESSPNAVIDAGDAWLIQAESVGTLTLTSPEPRSTVSDLLDATTYRLLHGTDERVTFEYRDHLGSVAAVTDVTGAVTGRTQYHPFGTVRTGADAEPHRGFTGKERDESGLVYFGARYLDPAIGRWASPDPRFTDDVELDRMAESTCNYTYVMGRPASTLDERGEVFIAGAVLAIAAVVVGTVGLYKILKKDGHIPSLPKSPFHRETIRARVTETYEVPYAGRTAATQQSASAEMSSVLSGGGGDASSLAGGGSGTRTESYTTSYDGFLASRFDLWRGNQMRSGGILSSIIGQVSGDTVHAIADAPGATKLKKATILKVSAGGYKKKKRAKERKRRARAARKKARSGGASGAKPKATKEVGPLSAVR